MLVKEITCTMQIAENTINITVPCLVPNTAAFVPFESSGAAATEAGGLMTRGWRELTRHATDFEIEAHAKSEPQSGAGALGQSRGIKQFTSALRNELGMAEKDQIKLAVAGAASMTAKT